MAIPDAGLARAARSLIAESGGIWRGDAVYTIPTALPCRVAKKEAGMILRDRTVQRHPGDKNGQERLRDKGRHV